jgi:hypothetical protein
LKEDLLQQTEAVSKFQETERKFYCITRITVFIYRQLRSFVGWKSGRSVSKLDMPVPLLLSYQLCSIE